MLASRESLELTRRGLREHQIIETSGEVNWLIDELCCERLPAINLGHAG